MGFNSRFQGLIETVVRKRTNRSYRAPTREFYPDISTESDVGAHLKGV